MTKFLSSFFVATLLFPVLLRAQTPCAPGSFGCDNVIAAGQIPTVPIRPFAGSHTWFNPARGGEGWTFSELPGPLGQPPVGVGVTYTYETTGEPLWLLLQGSYTYPPLPTSIRDGAPIAVLNAGVFDGEGGRCPTCPWTAPTIQSRRYATGKVTFLRTDLASVELDGQQAGTNPSRIVPTELVLTRPMPHTLAGQWRFTQRQDNLNGTYSERNFAQHGCSLQISHLPNGISRDHRFDVQPGQTPTWIPPSGAHVQWFAIDGGITCGAPINSTPDFRLRIAYDPNSTSTYRAAELISMTEQVQSVVVAGIPQSVVVGYTVSNASRFTEVFLVDSDTLILHRYTLNNRLAAEYILRRAP